MRCRLRQQLEDREADLEQQVERAVARQLGAAEQRWQQQLMPAAAERGVQRWVADALPQLLQPMQDAVAATAELAAGIAADVVEVAREVEQLAAAHRNHEQRLCRYEEGAMQASDAAADASASAAAVEQLRQQVRSLQMGHAQLDEGLQQLRQEQAAEAAHGDWQYRQQSEAAMPQLPAVQQRLAAVVDQQAAQAKTTEHLVSSGEALHASSDASAWRMRHHLSPCLPCAVTTDVMALARHTKALDREVRCFPVLVGWVGWLHGPTLLRGALTLPASRRAPTHLPQMRHLRKEVQQAQQALLQSCSVFSRALAIPSPVGPFTSLPPQL